MCSVTVLAFLLELLMKNWGLFLLIGCAGVLGVSILTGALKISYNSLARSVMSVLSSLLCERMKIVQAIQPQFNFKKKKNSVSNSRTETYFPISISRVTIMPSSFLMELMFWGDSARYLRVWGHATFIKRGKKQRKKKTLTTCMFSPKNFQHTCVNQDNWGVPYILCSWYITVVHTEYVFQRLV